jgi:hypothetical protein
MENIDNLLNTLGYNIHTEYQGQDVYYKSYKVEDRYDYFAKLQIMYNDFCIELVENKKKRNGIQPLSLLIID